MCISVNADMVPNETAILKFNEKSLFDLLRLVLCISINSDKRDEMIDHMRSLTIMDMAFRYTFLCTFL